MATATLRALSRGARLLSTSTSRVAAATASYPFAPNAVTFPEPLVPNPSEPPPQLLKGTGLQAHLYRALPPPEKQRMLETYFSRKSPQVLMPGSVLTVTSDQAPTSFSGVLLSIRRRGPDTSFVLRNVVQRTGVEMQFFVNSPHVKEIKVLRRAVNTPGKGPKTGTKRMKRAKLFYLRESPQKMTAIAAGVKA